jgi:putative Mg2+ transporter-C (MgtC) family protein
MFNDIGWKEAALRLFLTVLAAALIGFERETNSRPAGLRTILLVALAACVAMLQTNLLLMVRGKAPDSYVVMDLMRLPLGILSGMGFIGAGAILHKNNLVVGVTTAATLWFVTVMGLCFGGGQTGLGITAAILGILILRGLRLFERQWLHDQSASLSFITGPVGPDDEKITRWLNEKGCRIANWSVSYSADNGNRKMRCDVHWRGLSSEQRLPSFLNDLAHWEGILELAWNRESNPKRG